MSCTLSFERRAVQVPSKAIAAATQVLWGLGVSVSSRGDDHLSALIRLGSPGIQDRIAVLQVELCYSRNRQEQEQWLQMCWLLPAAVEQTALA
ncbi:MAG: hypothetical protein HC921_00245 [Synechococcaceae cyanobacterium SM2_3_1]|nr:hypothetical protein [Synechococcaceae cyanobacterium SM2_3_1]